MPKYKSDEVLPLVKALVNEQKIFGTINKGLRPYIDESAANYFYQLNRWDSVIYADVTFMAMEHPRAKNLYVPFYIDPGIPVTVKTIM